MSKEQTDCIEAFVQYGPLRSYDHLDLMERILGPSLEVAEEVRDARGILTGWNLTIRRASPSPAGGVQAACLAELDKIAGDIDALDSFPPSIQSQQNIRLVNAFRTIRAALKSGAPDA